MSHPVNVTRSRLPDTVKKGNQLIGAIHQLVAECAFSRLTLFCEVKSNIVSYSGLDQFPRHPADKKKKKCRRRCMLRAEHLPISWLFIVAVDGAEEEKYVVEERRRPVVRQASN